MLRFDFLRKVSSQKQKVSVDEFATFLSTLR